MAPFISLLLLEARRTHTDESLLPNKWVPNKRIGMNSERQSGELGCPRENPAPNLADRLRAHSLAYYSYQHGYHSSPY